MRFGGASVADPASIDRVARRLLAEHDRGTRVVGVVSAMGDTTDDLLASQAGSLTDARHGNAKIIDIRAKRIRAALERYQILLVTGFRVPDAGAQQTVAALHTGLRPGLEEPQFEASA